MKSRYALFILLFILFATISFFYFSKPKEKTHVQNQKITKQRSLASTEVPNKEEIALSDVTQHETMLQKLDVKPLNKSIPKIAPPKRSPTNEVSYEIDEDGLVTIDGDIVLGTLPEGSAPQGKTILPHLELWTEGKVPFFIQGDLAEGQRVIQAIAMFASTPIHFTPYQGEEDVLVFQTAAEGCKSYLGKIGGKQPIWISLECSPREIAHEIMHALGFIHEQNRSDRDAYISVLWENIIETSRKNFELFPTSLMKVSGGHSFDFQSIMLYPPKMFTKNGLPTLQSLNTQNEIRPSTSLSASDKLRLEQAYLD